MRKKLIHLIALLTIVFTSGCGQEPTISLLCEKGESGDYILKWEIYPHSKNISLDIFVSDNDSVFPSKPQKTVNSNDYVTLIKDSIKPSSRKFFKISVSNKFSEVETNRFFNTESIQNFRDLGGYYTEDNLRVRWGKIYRSGSFNKITDEDIEKLKKLHIKSILDIQAKELKLGKKTINRIQSQWDNLQYHSIPIASNGYLEASQKLIEGQFLKEEAISYGKHLYEDMIHNYTSEYTQFFDFLCEENNYPIVFSCYLGKDQVGLASYLLLRALNVSPTFAEEDYITSNTGIDRLQLIQESNGLPEWMQETLTVLTQADITILKHAIENMKEKSGSVDEYMTKELELTTEKRYKLRSILLQ